MGKNSGVCPTVVCRWADAYCKPPTLIGFCYAVANCQGLKVVNIYILLLPRSRIGHNWQHHAVIPIVGWPSWVVWNP
jgi:hypothetical protein